MNSNDNSFWSSFRINQKALDFGVCNGFAYLINANGEIWINRLASSFNSIFQSLNMKKIETIFQKKEFYKIADLEAFPLDSVSYGNKLYIITEHGISVINLSSHHDKVKLNNRYDFKPISVTQKHGILFFSLGEQGLATLKPSYNCEDFLISRSPSTQIIVNRDMVVNLYPETPPEIFRIEHFNEIKYHRMPLGMLPPMLSPLKDTNKFFEDLKILGRNIVAPYSTRDKIILPSIDGQIFSLRPTPKDKFDLEIHSSISNDSDRKSVAAIHSNNLITEDNLNFTSPNLEDRRNKEIPIARYYHPAGLIEEYWDSVVFESNSGRRFKLVKDEEISEVRTYADSYKHLTLPTILRV